MAALVVGGALLPLLYFLQTVQKVSPISAIVQLMPLMLAAIGVDWEDRLQVLRVELANRALAPIGFNSRLTRNRLSGRPPAAT
jgi:hypothetical protein